MKNLTSVNIAVKPFLIDQIAKDMKRVTQGKDGPSVPQKFTSVDFVAKNFKAAQKLLSTNLFIQENSHTSVNIVRKPLLKKSIALGMKGFTQVKSLTSVNTVIKDFIVKKVACYTNEFTLVKSLLSVNFAIKLFMKRMLAKIMKEFTLVKKSATNASIATEPFFGNLNAVNTKRFTLSQVKNLINANIVAKV